MPSLHDIQKRIDSTTNTKQITKAMEVVSASKMSKAQQNVKSFLPYSEKMEEIIHSIAANSNSAMHPMLAERDIKKVGYFVITSDQGLAGAFNNNLLKRVYETIQKRHTSTDEYVVIVIGRVGYEFFRKRGMPILQSITGMNDQPAFDDVKGLASEAVQMFTDEEIDELSIFYNHFINAISQEVTKKQLLPITEMDGENQNHSSQYEYEPNQEQILENLLPQYIESLIYGAVLDSKASEHAARQTAMRSATDNANELIDDMTLEYNRARQDQITQEITEIIGGVAAQE